MKKDKKPEAHVGDQSFRHSWTCENAMYILQHPTVDAKLWAEAVEWLLLHGPDEVRELLLSASMYATGRQFPGLKAAGCTQDGELCYDIAKIAEAIGIDPAEAEEILRQKERSHGIRHGFENSETNKIQ